MHSNSFEWLNQLLARDALTDDSSNQLFLATTAIRSGNYRKAELILLAKSDQSLSIAQCLILLAYLKLLLNQWSIFESILKRLVLLEPDQPTTRWLLVENLLHKQDLVAVNRQGSSLWHGEDQCLPLRLAHVRERILAADLDSAEQLLGELLPSAIPEAIRHHAQLLFLRGKRTAAVAQLQELIQRSPYDLALQEQFLSTVIDARQASLVVPAARQALNSHGEHPLLLPHIVAIKLYQRQPGLARRAVLIHKAWNSVGVINTNHANHLITYEQSGHADWFQFLHAWLLSSPLETLDLHSNLALQLASIESPRLRSQLEQFIASLRSTRAYGNHLKAGSGIPIARSLLNRKLRIAWITGDLAPHPVSRFLLGFFEASEGLRKHDHQLVSVYDHGAESNRHWFEQLSDLPIVEMAHYQSEDRVAAIRALQADVAIDLSGWTGANFLAGFMARLAPVQVNYLGYFATTGLPEMDYWLGDQALFPDPVTEWHTETIWRLTRPFLAWQPGSCLPEASAQITDSPSGGIRLGSFNHNRKLSDCTLRLWGQILQRISGSTLVLKANAQDDSATQELLRRRLVKAGIDPARVHWIPLTATPAEHLLQYRHIDIALDPLPNGGCTTTCEALWMGVPVITLAGSSYVSRMSTAVLQGAGLNEWISASEQHYIALACAQADQLQALRNRRDHWRSQLQSSPLGNAADLMYHLEQAFSAMHANALAKGAVCL
jgi:predicted O-linked N-acetylglucosamine transferase (SPINDLY family)